MHRQTERPHVRWILGAVAMSLATTACEREQRPYRELPAAAERASSVRVGQLEPGEGIGSDR